ncbi:hypothetical protein NDI37_19600 [Funiculus sociatus GB2-A5]|uniref:Uncharacterized protein n=1 Tax=Funiculus sociatus GB2-A5 TaxID=2933946 RepID=A0ABV0JU69_9CYAN|nr:MULTISPECIES: hypothetical protein [unclassified Trichocoleus]MBD1907590.1 hypothetical protein [Trichocoleus sp. FACHB-832]MBD2063709.1 hypothetical protein [Trichocoleus sp. FACHB-6]
MGATPARGCVAFEVKTQQILKMIVGSLSRMGPTYNQLELTLINIAHKTIKASIAMPILSPAPNNIPRIEPTTVNSRNPENTKRRVRRLTLSWFGKINSLSVLKLLLRDEAS